MSAASTTCYCTQNSCARVVLKGYTLQTQQSRDGNCRGAARADFHECGEPGLLLHPQQTASIKSDRNVG